MSVTYGPRRGVMINALTGDNFDADFRKFLRAIDALLFCSVVNLSTSAPPGSPANGDAYIVKATGTGAWAGHDNAIAIWTTDNPAGSVWEFYPAAGGMIVYSIADVALAAWNGSAWAAVGGGGGGGGGSSTLAGDTDVSITSPVDAQVLTYDGPSGKWKNETPSGGGGGGGSSTLAGDTDVSITSPVDAQVLTYDGPSGKWKNETPSGGGGGGGIPAGTPLTIGVRGTGSNPGWSNYTFWTGIFGEFVLQPSATKFKIRLSAIGGTGISIASAYLVATARGGSTVLASPAPLQITFNSGSAAYATPFSGASATNPFYLDSDAMTASIDCEHDWYIYIYLDADGTGYNGGIVLWGASGGPGAMAAGHNSGSLIPIAGGTVGSLSASVPLVVLVMAG